jgi:hypothetical protein
MFAMTTPKEKRRKIEGVRRRRKQEGRGGLEEKEEFDLPWCIEFN